MPLWIPVAMTAALFQCWRTAMQQKLRGLMSVNAAGFVRYLYGVPMASLLFGAAGAISPALQSVGVTQGYYLFSAAPYVLTLAIMIATCSTRRTLAGAVVTLAGEQIRIERAPRRRTRAAKRP